MLKKTAIIAAVAATVGGAGWLGVSFKNNQLVNVPGYRAAYVADGDTFMTEEKRYIRMIAYDAPELDRCGGEQAKNELEKLILDRDLYLKVIYTDGTQRLMSLVYTDDGLVDIKMLESGWVELANRSNLDLPELTVAVQKAQAEKRGVFSSLCTQTVNPKNPNCFIKGNIGKYNQKAYHFPGCNHYNAVSVQLHHGDQWFCTEAAAKKAGFTKGDQCPEKYQPSR